MATSKMSNDLPQLCYEIAYFLLPQMLFADEAKTIARFANSEFSVGTLLYAIVCKAKQRQPSREEATAFKVHNNLFPDGGKYYVLEYPSPPRLDINHPDFVLAPYFSGIIQDQTLEQTDYYTLGQNPMGGTTLRAVYPDGSNANLGSGPPPNLADFLDALRSGKR